MKKSELKKVLKPIIKECIQETLFKEGLLSNIISEIMRGLNGTQQPIVEQNNEDEIRQMQLEEKQKRSQKAIETRKKMLAISILRLGIPGPPL